ncbi:unnamed protein product, partial [Rotaria sp. Silwood1]
NIDPDMNDLSSENDASSHDSQSDYSSDESEATHDQIEIERQTFLQQLIEFIRDANLNKTTTSSLLSLLNSSKSYDEIPVSINQLLKQLDVKFYYDSFVYCSTCLTSLSKIQDRCINCGTSKIKANSELIIFSVADELRRVVQSNIELIKWYSFRENQMISDIVLGDIYKERCSNNSTLTLMITTDGKPMIKSKATRTSVWPWSQMIKDYPGAIAFIDDFLNSISYPHSFNRTPKGFLNYGKWKASELRTFLVYVSLPALVRLRLAMPKCFPEVYVYHFSLYFIYIRNLRHFSNRDEIREMPTFIEEYLKLFSSLYDQCAELYSAHALYHLHEQVEEHGGLAHHSLFSTESCLNHIAKLSHGSISLGQQISYWWCIHRQINSRKMINRPTLFTKSELILDSFFVYDVIENYRQEFDLAYNQTFGEFPPQSMKFYSRYVHGLIVYHSMSYSRRNKSNSFSVLIETRNLRGEPINCFGQILLYFYVNVLFKYPMAYYSGSRTPSGKKKSSYTGVSTQSKFDDDYELEVEGDNDFDNDYPIIRDVPFYNSQQRHFCDSQSNRNKISEKDRYYTPQLKRKRGSEAIDRFPFDSFAKQLENMQTMMSDINHTVNMMVKKETEVEKRLENVDKRITGLARQNPTPIQVPSDVPKVMYNGRNLLAGPIEPTPGGLMKQLINDLFTEDEIILGYHEQVNEKTDKIKEAVKNYFFRDDDENFRVFWGFDGHITRGNQRRGRAYRKKKNDLEQQKSVQLNTTASDINDGDQNKN